MPRCLVWRHPGWTLCATAGPMCEVTDSREATRRQQRSRAPADRTIHRKARGMAIIERDAVSFDVLLLEFARPESDPELIEAGRRVFGGARAARFADRAATSTSG